MAHVLFVITKSNWGGAQRYVYDLATNPQPGFTVAVVAGGNGILIQRLEEAGVRTIPLRALQRDVSLLKDLWSMFELYAICRKEKPDVVHLNSSKVGALGAFAARLAGVPRIIFTAHNWFHNESRPIYVRAVTWLIQALTQLLVHQTIAVSDAMVKTAPFPTRCVRVYNGVRGTALRARSEAREYLLAKGAILDDRIAVGTIGELHKNKGHDVLLEAFVKLRGPATLTIIGEGEERPRTEARVQKLGLANVSLVGHVDGASEYLSAFDVFVLPSRTEAFAYVLLEAGLASLPVVATNVGGIPELITEKTGVLVRTNDPEALTQGLDALIASHEARVRYGSALHTVVTCDFSMEDMVAKTYAYYA